jgi:hypothetical protein
MNVFSSLGKTRKTEKKQATSSRLSVESLEDRRLLATFTVGTAGSGANFSSLQAAIAGAATNDTILVIPTGTTLGSTSAGTNFGTTAGAMAVGAKTVTLSSAPNTSPTPGDLVTFTTNNTEKLIVSAYNSTTLTFTFTTGARFAHNAGDTVTATGEEGIWKQVNINGSPLASRESITGGNLWIAGGITMVVISHVNLGSNNLTIDESSNQDLVTDVTAATITDNPYTDPTFKATPNTISFSTITSGIVVHGNTFGSSMADQITNNTITGNVQLFNAGDVILSMNTISGGVDIEGAGATAMIEVVDNTITGTTSNVTANGNGTVTAGVVVVQPTPSATPVSTVSVEISGNTINTSGATAIALSLDTLDNTAGQNFRTRVLGNDLRNNKIGVAILGDNQGLSTSAGDIVITGNNFKSFTPGSSTSFAVTLNGTGSSPTGTPTVNAKGNFFASSVTDESKIVQDAANGSGTGVITVDSPPATSAQGAVNAMYFDILARAADPSGLAFWSSQPQSSAALGLLFSRYDAETTLVNNFYEYMLARNPDFTGQQFYVSLLNSGGTVETVLTDMLSSAEFYNRSQTLNIGDAPATNRDQRYVAALYQFLLGRDATPSDLTFWTNLLNSNSNPNLGRALVAGGFLYSAEFRQRIVTNFYGATTVSSLIQLGFPNLMHRTTAPSTSEVSFWANGTMDIRSIEAIFMSTPEFATNG